MSEMRFFMQPPPPGVECDCYEDDGHFHIRFMGANCDFCGENIEDDFHVFTRAGAYEAIATRAESLGWVVDREANVYKCADCVSKG